MKVLLNVCIFLIWIVYNSESTIWIKNIKSYGPSTAHFGAKCLSTMSKFYLKDQSSPRARNLVVSYTRNLTIPADNIQRLFLKWIHEAIVRGEIDE